MPSIRGGGEAETVAYLCHTTYFRKKILKMGSWRQEDTLDDVARFLDPYRNRLSSVRVDGIGIGHNLGLYLRKKGSRLNSSTLGGRVRAARACMKTIQRRFINDKARYYQSLADDFERDGIDGLVDDVTIGQLAGILYEIESRGRIKIEPKEKAKERGVPSPDRAEALMLAIGEAPCSYEFIAIRGLELPKLGKQAQIDALDDSVRHGLKFRDWGKKGVGW